MAARRLLIVMLVLLGISTLAAALVPPQHLRQTTMATQTQGRTTPADTLPSGRLLEGTIDVGGPKRPVVPIQVGDELALVVTADRRDDVEIPALGLVEPIGPFTPARFDILARMPGSYAIRFVQGNAVIARIVVSKRNSSKRRYPGGRRRLRGPSSRAPGAPARA
jgi:hypothetical protein